MQKMILPIEPPKYTTASERCGTENMHADEIRTAIKNPEMLRLMCICYHARRAMAYTMHMKTTGGVVGVITIAIIALVVGVISQTQTPTQPVTIEDGGTQTPQTTPDHRYEPTIHTKDAAELTPTQDIGSGWDTGVRHSTETATKQRPTPSSDKTAAESVPSTVHATNSHEHGEMVQVSDMWKSTTPLRTDESPSTKPQKEDEVHQTIRKFGNDVGTLVQTFVLTHSKQAERLGDFTMTRTDDGRTYVTSLADGDRKSVV